MVTPRYLVNGTSLIGVLFMVLVYDGVLCLRVIFIYGQAKLKTSFWSSCLVNFLPSENTDRQTDTYKETLRQEYIHIQTVMLLHMYKNLET